jgi:hypothetical protein
VSKTIVIGSIIGSLLLGCLVGFWFGQPKASVTPAHAPMPAALRSAMIAQAKDRQRPATSPDANSELGLQPYPPGFEGMGVNQILTAEPVSMRWIAMLAWADRVTKEDLPRELRRLAALHSAEGTTRFAFHFLLSKWGQREPDLTLASLISAKGTIAWAGTEGPQLIAAVAAGDPQKAAEMATSESFRSLRGIYYDGIAARLARLDPKSAQELADRLPEKQKQEAMRGIAETISVDLSTLPPSELQSMDKSLRAARLNRWIEKDPAAVTAWATAHAGRVLDEVLVAIAEIWAGKDAAAALAWSNQNLPPTARDQALPTLIESLAEEDLGVATEWMTLQEPTEGAQRAMDKVCKQWPDVKEAVAWVQGLPAGELQDHGFISLSNIASSRGNHSQAVDIAVSLRPENPKRVEALEGAFTRWFTSNEKEARAWFSSTKELTKHEREVLGK